MTTTISATAAATNGAAATIQKNGFGSLGSADFLKLMTTQMQQQDPFNPMDNKDMLAQMAQFSSLSEMSDVSGGVSNVNATLKDISAKLDAVLTAQQVAAQTAPTSAASPTA